jgi:hypothetical protein
MLPQVRLTGFDVMLAMGVVAAATLSCWLWLYQELLDSRRMWRGDVRTNLIPLWNPLAWWIGAVGGLLAAIYFFSTYILPWARLRWSQDAVPLLFLAACILVAAGAVAIAYLLRASLSYLLYPIQIMILALIHAPGWRERLLVLLANIFILTGAALALLALSQSRLL